jgi:hypothetical protein
MNVHFDSSNTFAEHAGRTFSISSHAKGCPSMHMSVTKSTRYMLYSIKENVGIAQKEMNIPM